MDVYLVINISRFTIGIEVEKQVAGTLLHLNLLPIVSLVFVFKNYTKKG